MISSQVGFMSHLEIQVHLHRAIDRIKLRTYKSINVRDFQFEIEIYQICSPFITNKIILEKSRAKDPKIYNVLQINSFLFDVRYNGENPQNLVIKANLKSQACYCSHLIYSRSPYAYFFAVLLKKKEEIVKATQTVKPKMENET